MALTAGAGERAGERASKRARALMAGRPAKRGGCASVASGELNQHPRHRERESTRHGTLREACVCLPLITPPSLSLSLTHTPCMHVLSHKLI